MRRYIVDENEDLIFYNEKDAASYVVGGIEFDDEEFDDAIDEIYPEIEVFGAHYLISFVIKNVDSINYYCAKAEWDDEMRMNYVDETVNRLLHMYDGDVETFWGYDVRCEDDEDEEPRV